MSVCPLCGRPGQPWRVVSGCEIEDCTACAHRFYTPVAVAEHVSQHYGDDYFFGGGAGYPDYLAEADLLQKRGRWYAELAARHAPPGQMLELGAAAGFTVKSFAESGWTAIGLEPNASMASYGRDQLGVDVRCEPLQAIAGQGPFDLCLMLQVVAHLIDLRPDLESVAQLLRPGGLCLVETWDRDSLPARLLGAGWHEYSPPTVLHWFSRASLDRTMGELGFSPLAWGRPKKRISGAHVKSLLSHSAGRSLANRAAAVAAAAVPDKMEFPYPSWDLFWRLYRKTQ